MATKRSPKTYAEKVAELEAEGLTTSDAQAAVDAEALPARAVRRRGQRRTPQGKVAEGKVANRPPCTPL